jgi:outer membrane protein assembly factor BamB
MKTTSLLVSSCLVVCSTALAPAKDWPQWLGENRDGKAAFDPPKTWPKELARTWKVTVGDGVATPTLVGDKLYVFTREEGGEILRCLDAASGKEIWKSEKQDVLPANGPAQGFSGPRSTPTVADGKVVTLGLRGAVTCYDAASGKQLWRKEDFKGSLPRFFTSASPIVADGLCIVQLGGNESGGVIAYDLASGEEKWKWTGDGPSYASAMLMTVSGTKLVIAETDKKIVGLGLRDGKLLWETPFVVPGRGYNASTPIVDGDTLIYCGSGRGATAVKIEKEVDGFVAKELWKNADNSVQFNTPVLKSGTLYGLTANNEFFCINKEGKTAWTAPLTPPVAGAETPPPANAQPGPGGPGGGREGGPGGPPGGLGGERRGRGMGGGGGGRGGYGSIVDAGSVLLALTPATSELVAFQPNDKSYTEVARIKVSSAPTYAYPVVSGNRIFIKDQNDVMLYTIQ